MLLFFFIIFDIKFLFTQHIFSGIPIIRGNRFRRDQRQMEEEEEMWFNEEEDLEELETYNSVMKCE